MTMTKAAFFLDLTGWPCLVAGGNATSAERCKILLSAGAVVSCWSEDFHESFKQLKNHYRDQISLVRGNLDTSMLTHMLRSHTGPRLVVICTDKPDLNQSLFEVCEENFVPASLPGSDARLNFARRIDRGALNFSVSAEPAPELEEMLSRKFDREIPDDWSDGSTAYAKLRQSEGVKQMHPDLRDHQMRELASALIDCNGRYEAAKIRTERRLGKEF